ncbi:MAG TPA: N-acetylmuramoyl-L-alanine amidase [Clostridium sp.]
MLQIQKLLINYNSSARSESAKYIIVHDVGGISTAKNNRDYFAGGNRNASADFFVDSNNIIQAIDYHTRYSWAVGDGRGERGKTNGNTVNIEMCLENDHMPSDQTVQNTLDLVKYLMIELGISIDYCQRHFDCSGKNCPGSFSSNNWEKWYEFKARLAGSPITIVAGKTPNVAPVVSRSDETPTQAPLNFSYPNNAKVVGTDLYIRDANGIKQAGHYVSNNDVVTVLDVGYTSGLVKLEYPTSKGVASGFVRNTNIVYLSQGTWHNGSTGENIYQEANKNLKIGSLSPRESATPLYKKNGFVHLVYNTDKGLNSKSGYSAYMGGL